MLTLSQTELRAVATPSLALFQSISVPDQRKTPAPPVETVLASTGPGDLPGNVPGWHAAPAIEACRTMSCPLTRAAPHVSFL
jgi:hypothetical protein